jgi:hypothetical protein
MRHGLEEINGKAQKLGTSITILLLFFLFQPKELTNNPNDFKTQDSFHIYIKSLTHFQTKNQEYSSKYINEQNLLESTDTKGTL